MNRKENIYDTEIIDKDGSADSVDMAKIAEEREEALKLTREKVKIHELINFDKEPENPVKVSVVVPVCNVEQYLRECIDSCINQTLREIEIICVNDGSSDNSLEILKEYAAKDPRVKVINKDNAGYGHTMNIGMDMACGEYIGIVESDDFADLHMYEDLYKIAVENELELVKADFNRFVYENGKIKKFINKVAKEPSNYNKVVDSHEDPGVFRYVMNTWSGIYSRDFLVKFNIRHNETPGASFQDNGFWFQTFIRSHRMYFVDKPYYMNRRDNPNSSVHNKQKVYCITEEYKYIRDLMDSSDYAQFKGIYTLKKYHNYMFSYNRIAEEYKLEFLEFISREYKLAIENGELDESLFEKYELEDFLLIANDYEEYYRLYKPGHTLVSVILPVYNVAPYLPECLDSIINQTCTDIEIICVDDGSTDNSLEILNEYARKDSRIIVISQENNGAGAARNRGLEIAAGEYLSFLDADDFFEPDLFSEMYEKCKHDHADIGIYKIRIYDEKTKNFKASSNSFIEENIPKKVPFSYKDMPNTIFSTFQNWAWNKLFRRKFIADNNLLFQDTMRTNDMFFVNMAMMKADRITVRRKEFVNYRTGHSINCQATNHLYPLDFYHAFHKLKITLEEEDIFDTVKTSYINQAMKSIVYNFNSISDADSAMIMYNFMHEEGITNLGLDDFDSSIIFKENKSSYDEFKKIRSQSYPVYMYGKLTYYRTETDKLKKKITSAEKSKAETEKKKSDAEKKCTGLEKKCTELEKTVSTLKKQFDTSSGNVQLAVNFELQKALISQYDHSNKQTERYVKLIEDYKRQNDELNYVITETRKSLTYKIGRFITWIPRKLLSIIK